MKKFLMMLGISCLALTIEAQAQNMVQVEAPADADVTIYFTPWLGVELRMTGEKCYEAKMRARRHVG